MQERPTSCPAPKGVTRAMASTSVCVEGSVSICISLMIRFLSEGMGSIKIWTVGSRFAIPLRTQQKMRFLTLRRSFASRASARSSEFDELRRSFEDKLVLSRRPRTEVDTKFHETSKTEDWKETIEEELNALGIELPKQRSLFSPFRGNSF